MAPRINFETEDVYCALVADLARTIVPTSIMAATLLTVGAFGYWSTGITSVFIVTSVGGFGSAYKIVLQLRQMSRLTKGDLSMPEARRWEVSHLVATAVVATSVGALTTIFFRQPDLNLQLLGTALLFGYCSGIVARVAIRPYIAIPALIMAAGPAIIATALWQDAPHRYLSCMFAIFLFGGCETALYVYKTASRHITTRLDMSVLAYHDPVTGLANRLGLQRAYRLAVAKSSMIAVHCLDLDGFKGVNDAFGHSAGDDLLVQVARRIRTVMPEGSVVARVGGDEFVALQFDTSDDINAYAIGRSIVQELAKPFPVENENIQITASLGFAVAPAHRSNLGELLKLADAASYHVKKSGGGGAMSSLNLH
ncbi:GGDEF domain-containing protein [Burkholderia gladioli]|uniref:GGDEF domain-containing protein n=1 Tax=Burkholderia gladioli TaxID=28095 RepID=UPI0030D1F808